MKQEEGRRTDDIERGRLPGSVGPQQREYRVLRHPEAHIIHDAVLRAPKCLHNAHDAQRIRRARHLLRLVVHVAPHPLWSRSAGTRPGGAFAELGELADDDGARVDPDEDAEEREAVEEEVQDRAAVARDVAEGRRGYGRIAIAEQREQVDGNEGRS